MSYRIVEIDGLKIDPTTQKFPVEVHPEVHAINGVEHTGILDDEQIPSNIMRKSEHQNDPHTMIIDGRDVSVDGAKLDTIENGAQVNNLTNQQATSLTSGSHSSWHHHDSFYYRKSDLQNSGDSQVHWSNITNKPTEYNPSSHNHDSRYYTQTQLEDGQLDNRYHTKSEVSSLYYNKTELDNGQLDNRYYTETEVDDIISNYYTRTQLNNGQLDTRYYTETEIDAYLANKANVVHNHDSVYYTKTQLSISGTVGSNVLDDRYYTEGEITSNYYDKSDIDSLIAAASYGISGSVDLFSQLPTVDDIGIVYIVRQEENSNKEGFYRWDGSDWVWLAHNIGGTYHNDLLGLNNGEYKHLTSNQQTLLTTGVDASSLHNHNGQYYTEKEIDNYLSNYYTKDDLDNGQLDNRYYLKSEVDNYFSNYYTKDDLDNGQLDDRYYTEDEVSSLYYDKIELDGGQLDDRYYTETEIDNTISNYYTKIELDGGQLDDRYYTETETDSKFSLYFTKTQLLNGSIDDRYYTENELNNGALDFRYYTETEIDDLIAAAAYGISGSVDTYNDLPTVEEVGIIYIVKQDSVDGEEGFYKWDGVSWDYLAPNTGETLHNNLSGLNDGDYKHLTSSEYSSLTGSGNATNLHIHDDRYYTETETDSLLSGKSDVGHTHDNRYYTETEIDNYFNNYYTSQELNNGQLDNRYYTETELSPAVDVGQNVLDARYYTEDEISTNYYNKTELEGGSLDDRYYTKTEISQMTSLYYTKSSLDSGQLDDRYYTEIEIDDTLSNYYTKNQLDTGSLDTRYYTENEIDSNYYDKNSLNSGSLDFRYYTETEVDNLIAAVEVFGIRGSVDTYNDLPTTVSENDIYIVKQDSVDGEEGFYKWDGAIWVFLANNTGSNSHNDFNGLNIGDYLHLTANEYSGLTSGGETSLHIHDDRYYTETEIDDTLSNYYTSQELDDGSLDDRYYTETEADNLLDNKSDVGHTHDDLYYTETEIDNLLDNKSDVGHTHDDRYNTKSEISSKYYSKSQLNNGQLDDRYYTETEADDILSNKSDIGHIHDDRYYTETEIDDTLSNYYTSQQLDNGSLDTRYYTETELDVKFGNKSNVGHTHDDRYYTESELGSSGAQLIGIDDITGITSTNVQGALEEIKTDLDSTSSTLQDAYNSGNSINTDSNGPVELSGTTNPPLKIENQSTAPGNPSAGSIAVINNKLYVYDGVRSKWLTPSKFLSFGRNYADGNVLDIHGSSFYGTSYKMVDNGAITSFTAEGVNTVDGKVVRIRINNSNVKTFSMGSSGYISEDSLNIDFNKDDNISVVVESNGFVLYGVVVNMEVCWRA